MWSPRALCALPGTIWTSAATEAVEEASQAAPRITTARVITVRALSTASADEVEDRGDKVSAVEGPQTRIYDSWVWAPGTGGPRGRETAAGHACLFYSSRVKIQARLEVCTDACHP